MSADTRKESWLGLEETLSSAAAHLSTYVDQAREQGMPLVLHEGGDEENGMAGILEHALDCVEATYAAMEDGDIVERAKLTRVVHNEDTLRQIVEDTFLAAAGVEDGRAVIVDLGVRLLGMLGLSEDDVWVPSELREYIEESMTNR